MAIEWKDEYSVGIAEIDDQHKKMVDTINELYDAINNLEYTKKRAMILDRIEDYTRVHFATEEKYFDLFNYELSDEHKEEHRKFKDKVAALGKKVEMMELVDFLEDWLIMHLIEQDHKYVDCFKKNGLK